MAPSSRDRISVDLRGLKAALIARSRERCVSPSEFVRSAVMAALGADAAVASTPALRPSCAPDRVRLSMRIQRDHAQRVLRGARDAGLTTGDFVVALVANAPVLEPAASAATHLAALTASCAELATLSRDLRHLSTLLRQGSTRAAQAYRERLDSVNADVHAHLHLATNVVAALQPLMRSIPRPGAPVVEL